MFHGNEEKTVPCGEALLIPKVQEQRVKANGSSKGKGRGKGASAVAVELPKSPAALCAIGFCVIAVIVVIALIPV